MAPKGIGPISGSAFASDALSSSGDAFETTIRDNADGLAINGDGVRVMGEGLEHEAAVRREGTRHP